eukprot:393627_1
MSLSRIIAPLLFALMEAPTTVNGLTYRWGYAPMLCHSDSNYINDWDGRHDNTQINYFLSGMYSVHNNYREDRRFKWDYCNAKEEANAENEPLGFKRRFDLDNTDYDERWVRDCGGNAAMIGAKSEHDNYREDRRWGFECGEIQPEDIDKSYQMYGCFWSGYLNSFDGVVDHECSNDGVIQGLASRHDNYKEDRIWRVKCCRIAYTATSALVPPEDVLFLPEENILFLVVLAILSVCCGGVCGMMERCRRKKEYPTYERVVGTDDIDSVDAV